MIDYILWIYYLQHAPRFPFFLPINVTHQLGGLQDPPHLDPLPHGERECYGTGTVPVLRVGARRYLILGQVTDLPLQTASTP